MSKNDIVGDLAAYRQELAEMMSVYQYLAINRPEKRDWYNARATIVQRELLEFDLKFYNKYLAKRKGDKQ